MQLSQEHLCDAGSRIMMLDRRFAPGGTDQQVPEVRHEEQCVGQFKAPKQGVKCYLHLTLLSVSQLVVKI